MFDGHGANGHHASGHVKKKLPGNISKSDAHLRGKGECGECAAHQPSTFQNIRCPQKRKVLKEAFRRTNTELGKRNFDVNFSGTTGCVVILSGDVITAANVGDSRAILATCTGKGLYIKQTAELSSGLARGRAARKVEQRWTATPLSRDHKPDHKLEKERILSKGGRVEPFKGERIY